VELVEAALGDEAIRDAVGEGADAVFAARVLHHAPRPPQALAELAELCRPGGVLVVIDYAPHGDERMRTEQADAWLGFEAAELRQWAKKAGLEDVAITPVPAVRCGDGPDGHLDWQVLAGRRV
jgi:ArsR family transcriptional regulator